MCPKIGNKIEEKSFWNDDSWYYYPKMLILCPYSITTWKEIEHLDKNTFAFFMELLWKELWCLHFSKICSNEMADTGHYLNWVTQSFTTLMEDFSQDKNRDSSFSDYNNVNGMIFDPHYTFYQKGFKMSEKWVQIHEGFRWFGPYSLLRH